MKDVIDYTRLAKEIEIFRENDEYDKLGVPSVEELTKILLKPVVNKTPTPETDSEARELDKLGVPSLDQIRRDLGIIEESDKNEIKGE